MGAHLNVGVVYKCVLWSALAIIGCDAESVGDVFIVIANKLLWVINMTLSHGDSVYGRFTGQ
jgi:hypothetical protein